MMTNHEGDAVSARHARFFIWKGSGKIRKAIAWYFTELLVVFLGITAGFLFDEWRTENDNWSKRKDLLTSLRRDIVIKQNEIANDSLGFHYLAKASILMQKVAYGQLDYDDSLKAYYFNIIDIDWFFEFNTPAYEVLKFEDNWSLLQSDSLFKQVYLFYQSSLLGVHTYYNKTNSYHSNVLTPFLNSLEIYRSIPNTANVMLRLSIKNVLAHPSAAPIFFRFSIICQSTLFSLRSAHKRASQLLAHIDYELARHGP